jgi:repressor LexA
VGSSDGEATVKTLKMADGHTSLILHHPAYSPMIADNAVIVGEVVTVLRGL